MAFSRLLRERLCPFLIGEVLNYPSSSCAIEIDSDSGYVSSTFKIGLIVLSRSRYGE